MTRNNDLGGTNSTSQKKNIWSNNSTHLLFICLLLVPIFIWPTVPSQDLPNHMGRIYILSHLQDYSHLYRSAFYPPPPYLLIDALGMVLAKVFSLVAAGKIIFALQILSVPAATIGLSRLYHRTKSPWEYCGYAIAYNAITGFGFANFIISLALIAVEIKLLDKFSDSKLKLFVIAGVGISVIVLTHLTGLLLFFFLYTAFLVNRGWTKESPKESLFRQFGVTFIASIPSWLYYKKITSFYSGYKTEFSAFDYKLSIIPNALNFDSNIIWKLSLFAICASLLIGVLYKSLKTNLILVGLATATMLLFLVSPTSSMSGYNIDVRLFLVALMVLITAFTSQSSRFLPIFGSLVFAQMTYLCYSSIDARKQYSEISSAINQIQPGDMFYSEAGFDVHGLRTMSFAPTIMNFPVLELASRNVYDCTVFAIPWQQPMLFQEKILKAQTPIQPVGNTEDITPNLRAIQESATASQYVYRANKSAWLFLTKQPETIVRADIGTIVASSSRWILFRIDKPNLSPIHLD